MLCNLSLEEVRIGSLQETNTFPHLSSGPAICAQESLRTKLQVSFSCVRSLHRDAYSKHIWLLFPSYFFMFLQ